MLDTLEVLEQLERGRVVDRDLIRVNRQKREPGTLHRPPQRGKNRDMKLINTSKGRKYWVAILG